MRILESAEDVDQQVLDGCESALADYGLGASPPFDIESYDIDWFDSESQIDWESFIDRHVRALLRGN